MNEYVVEIVYTALTSGALIGLCVGALWYFLKKGKI